MDAERPPGRTWSSSSGATRWPFREISCLSGARASSDSGKSSSSARVAFRAREREAGPRGCGCGGIEEGWSALSLSRWSAERPHSRPDQRVGDNAETAHNRPDSARWGQRAPPAYSAGQQHRAGSSDGARPRELGEDPMLVPRARCRRRFTTSPAAGILSLSEVLTALAASAGLAGAGCSTAAARVSEGLGRGADKLGRVRAAGQGRSRCVRVQRQQIEGCAIRRWLPFANAPRLARAGSWRLFGSLDHAAGARRIPGRWPRLGPPLGLGHVAIISPARPQSRVATEVEVAAVLPQRGAARNGRKRSFSQMGQKISAASSAREPAGHGGAEPLRRQGVSVTGPLASVSKYDEERDEDHRHPVISLQVVTEKESRHGRGGEHGRRGGGCSQSRRLASTLAAEGPEEALEGLAAGGAIVGLKHHDHGEGQPIAMRKVVRLEKGDAGQGERGDAQGVAHERGDRSGG